MTDFFMPCWKSAPVSRRLLTALALCWLIGWAALARADASVDLNDLQIEPAGDGLYLSARVRFDLPPVVEDALDKGIAVYFVAEAEVMRKRWYWYDRRLASSRRYMRVAYLPLTRRWRLNISSSPIDNSGLGVTLTQHYDTLDEAMAVVQRISRWRIATNAELGGAGRQSVRFRFRMDANRLPRTLQVGALGDADWTLSIERDIDLTESTP